MAIAAISRITGATDRLESAGSAAKAVLSEPSVTPIFAINAKTALAFLAVQNGNSFAAEDHYTYLLGYNGPSRPGGEPNGAPAACQQWLCHDHYYVRP